MRLVQGILVVFALLVPGVAAATFAAGQAVVTRTDNGSLACAAAAPVALGDDGRGQVYLTVGDAQRCGTFPNLWNDCRYAEGYRVLCRTSASRLALTFEGRLEVDHILSGPQVAWHRLEAAAIAPGTPSPAAIPPSS